MSKDVLKMFFIKSLRDLKSSFKQFLSIIFIIAIAVTLFVGLQANYLSINNRVNRMYEKGNMASLWLTYSMIGEEFKDEEEIKNLLEYDVNTEQRLLLPTYIGTTNVNICVNNHYPDINRASDLFTNTTDDPNVFTNVSPTTIDSTNYFIVDKRVIPFFGEKNLVIGDSLKLELDFTTYVSQIKSMMLKFADKLESVGIPEIFVDSIRTSINEYFASHTDFKFNIEPKITHFMNHPENIASSRDSASVVLMSSSIFMNTFSDEIYKIVSAMYPDISRSTFDTFFTYFPSINNQLLIKCNSGRDVKKDSQTIRDYYHNKTESTESDLSAKLLYLTDISALPSNASIQNDVEQANTLSFVFPLIFLLVAVLIVITTITQLILKERTQIGTFKGLGLSNKEIIFHYEFTTLLLGLIGCAFGMVLGPCILPFLLDIKYQLLYSVTYTTYTFPALAAFITLFIILAVIGLITYLIVRKELHYSPAESMRPQAPKMKMKKTSSKKSKISFVSLTMALRNIRVYFTKSIMVIIGVMGCTSLLVCGFGIEDTVNFGIDNDMTKYYGSDITLTYLTADNSLTETIKNDTNINSKIKEIYGFPSMIATVSYDQSGQYNSYLLAPNSIVYDKNLLDCDFPENTVIVPKRRAEQIGLSVGDKITLEISGTKIEKEVSQIYEHFSIQYIFGHREDADFSSYSDSTCYIECVDNATNDEIDEVVKYLTETYSGNISSTATNHGMREKIKNYVGSVEDMTNAIKAFAVLLAVICLLNLALLNFKERTREIATMKVLGFSSFEIAKSLVYEVLILTFIGAFFGLALGMPMLMLVLGINQNSLVSFIYYVSFATYSISATISIGTALVINSALSLSIGRVSMVESLKSVE